MAENNKDGKKKIVRKMPKIIYTSEEEDWLVTNVMGYRHIIDNKKTDGATNRDKDQAWEKITKAFNVAPPGRERTVKSLREKYQKIKQMLKDRAYYFSEVAKQTCGGPPKKELPPLSDPMKQLAEIIMSTMIGLAATSGNSDNLIATQSAEQCASRELAFTGLIQTDTYEDVTVDDGFHYLGDEELVFDEVNINRLADPTHKECSIVETLTTTEPPTDQLTNPQKHFDDRLSDRAAVVDRSWDRVNLAKSRKPRTSLLNVSEVTSTISKMPESELKHHRKKHKIEIEILEHERERFKFERERAELDRDRAALDKERSAIELQRSKNQLAYDKEIQRIRLAALNRTKEVEIVPLQQSGITNPLETITSFQIVDVKEECSFD